MTTQEKGKSLAGTAVAAQSSEMATTRNLFFEDKANQPPKLITIRSWIRAAKVKKHENEWKFII